MIETWHCSFAAISNCDSTGIVAPEHVRVTVTGALEATSQVPGPASGRSATAKEGLSCPLSTPFEALTSGAFATGSTFDAVALEELALFETLAAAGGGSVMAGDTIFIDEALTVLERRGGSVEVVVAATVLVVGVFTLVVVLGAEEWRSGVELDDAVSVKTRTRSSMGLDHITQCALLSEWRLLILVLAGYWRARRIFE